MISPHRFSRLIDNPLRRIFISPELLLQRLALRGDEIVELGPGSGYFSAHLAAALPRGRLHLADVQPQMLEKARKKVNRLGMENVDFTTLDGGDLFPDSNFDAVVLVSVLGEVADQRSCLASLRRVLRPDGLLAIHESIPDPDLIRFDDLVSLVASYGFQLTRRFGRAYNYTAIFVSSSSPKPDQLSNTARAVPP